MDRPDQTPVIRLADYAPPPWRVTHVDLVFDLDAEATQVEATLALQPDPARPAAPLRLDGEDLELLDIALDGQPLPPARYRVDATGLTVLGVDAPCLLRTRVRIRPQTNTRLEGLYVSGASLMTQCEAEGFRRITWFVDRPDVSAVYTVTLRADRTKYPVLLSNGNPAGAGDLDDGHHWARFVDPHPKPCYLFALVAGTLGHLSAPFRTMDGRDVTVRVWAEPADVPRCRHALESTLRAMRWDEKRFGRAYDLDVFDIVAAQDFTMGAMENKGLNIFNARFILADIDTATDADFEAIESVIGHEYFHNWSGNRVTLRDWFQLSLKEGLTVFRDQEFTADLHSRAMKRIDDVRLLKSRQFAEDAGPLAHPVRPASYSEINNFYTATVYEKGAEIIRMLHTLLGELTFRRALDLYFARHDGGAATVEDLLDAMREASGRDLAQFARWYDQAGTPQIAVTEAFDPATGDYTLHLAQHTPATPDGSEKQPLHLPFAFALYDADDRRIATPPDTDAAQRPGLVELTAAEHTLRWRGLAQRPLPAFLQGLSAPARLRYDYAASDLGRLLRIESDALVRWECAQQLVADAVLRGEARPDARPALIAALGALLADTTLDPAFVAECVSVADVWSLADRCDRIDLDLLWREREALLDDIAAAHADLLAARYDALSPAALGGLAPACIAARQLRNVALSLLTRRDPSARRAEAQFAQANTLTDRLAALAALLRVDAPGAAAALAAFRTRHADDPLTTDKWLTLVVTRPQPDAVDAVRDILAGPLWQPRNPNRVRTVLGHFARNNPVAFHRRDGAGYALLFDWLPELDRINPQVAARQLTALEPWRRLDADRAARIEAHLRAFAALPLSRDSADVAGRLLG
ncbi:aminopeptidase N [Chiayiivirga flava]|uniref:Aminopeptidase N n=1 Tax=Chiayiivirga flava TaxID=659595 RepID=A0A7W8G084_9GAMM|nr:aminopeptidase N [Chiayiivirga flava]MBB5207458.1 aminopeptidase N [Chiayiivirga flava]